MAKVKSWTASVQFDHTGWYYKALNRLCTATYTYEATAYLAQARSIVFGGFCGSESANQAAETISGDLRNLGFTEGAFTVSVFEQN